MTTTLHTLQNDYWQVGILPQTGASIAYARANIDGNWIDALRPTDPANYGNPGQCASYLLIPWSNRIRDAAFRFRDQTYTLKNRYKDGTAIHGIAKNYAWQIDSADQTHIRLKFRSGDHADADFPFVFEAAVEYRVEEHEFIWQVTLTNSDTQPMPAGFGHHPYFPRGEGEDVQVQIPAAMQYELANNMPRAAAVPITPLLDFRALRSLDDQARDDVLTGGEANTPIRINYPAKGLSLEMHTDPIFTHTVVFTPPGKPFFAVEPVTHTNDGFNLFEQGVEGTGVFVLQAGEAQSGTVRLKVV